MPQLTFRSTPWTICPRLLLLLLLLHAYVATAAILPSSGAQSTSASADTSANRRPVRSAKPASNLSEEDDDKDGCSSDFVEKFFRLLSGPVGKEGEALVAAVLKILSEDDQLNWPMMADWTQDLQSQSRDILTASKLRQIFLDSAQHHRSGNEKRMAPKFNPTGWRRKRSVEMTSESLHSILQGLLARYDTSELLGRDDYAPKIAELSDDVKVAPEIPEWQNRKRSSSLPRRISRRLPSQLLPKRKPLEFNPTGW